MSLLEDVKRITEKGTGWKRPDDPQALLRERKPQIYRFKDDGLIPNHPKWPLVIYKSGSLARLSRSPCSKTSSRPMVGATHGATASTTMLITTRVFTKYLASRAAPAGFSLAAPKGARLS